MNWPGDLEQEPQTPLRLVDPVLDQARRRHVGMRGRQFVRLTQRVDQLTVIFPKLGQHIIGCDVIGIVVADALEAINMANRAKG